VKGWHWARPRNSGKFMVDETEKWERVVKPAGIKGE
jgi:hypothetical protein